MLRFEVEYNMTRKTFRSIKGAAKYTSNFILSIQEQGRIYQAES
jgi:hypothetical protein